MTTDETTNMPEMLQALERRLASTEKQIDADGAELRTRLDIGLTRVADVFQHALPCAAAEISVKLTRLGTILERRILHLDENIADQANKIRSTFVAQVDELAAELLISSKVSGDLLARKLSDIVSAIERITQNR